MLRISFWQVVSYLQSFIIHWKCHRICLGDILTHMALTRNKSSCNVVLSINNTTNVSCSLWLSLSSPLLFHSLNIVQFTASRMMKQGTKFININSINYDWAIFWFSVTILRCRRQNFPHVQWGTQFHNQQQWEDPKNGQHRNPSNEGFKSIVFGSDALLSPSWAEPASFTVFWVSLNATSLNERFTALTVSICRNT